jgi:O-antigen biosynthesis protein
VRVAFVAGEATPRQARDVVAAHVQALRGRHDIDALMLSTDETAGPLDVAVATDWRAARALERYDAGARAWLVQDLDGRRDGATAEKALELPLALIAGARWIATSIDRLRPHARALLVRAGVDKPARSADLTGRRDGPLRVLIVGDPSEPREGAADALEAVGDMREERIVSLLCRRADAVAAGADRVLGPRHAAALFADSDVVLHLAAGDGLPLAPLHGFHHGATCVMCPVSGHDEYLVDGFNGLAVSFDDQRGAARTLDLLARDRSFLAFLRQNALATARSWPSWQQAATMMALALRRIQRSTASGRTRLG